MANYGNSHITRGRSDRRRLWPLLNQAFCIIIIHTVWNVPKYGVFSGPYFPAFGLNNERYFVSLRIKSECGKIWTRKNSVFGHFTQWKVLVFYYVRCQMILPNNFTFNNSTRVDVGQYGSNNDSGVLGQSKISSTFKNNNLNLPESEVLPGTNLITYYS